MDAGERFAYFMRTRVELEEVRSLRNAEGWCGAGTEDGGESVPFWPEEAFVALMAEGGQADCVLGSIPFAGFCENWLPGMFADGVLAAVFPVPGDTVDAMDRVTLDGEQPREFLLDECEEVDGGFS